jgi:hypothetical protein
MVKRAAPAATVVQFNRPLSGADVAELRTTYGLALDHYIPKWTYLERLEPETVARLRLDPRVGACFPYDPAAKLDPSTAARAGENVAAEERLPTAPSTFRAFLFDDSDPGGVERELVAIGAREVRILDDRALGGRLRVSFALDDGPRVIEVAALDDVVWIDVMSPMKSDGPPDGVATATGADAATAALWERGLHGEGQVIGVLDNGPPDLDHCFFADADPNLPGPGHRKIVAVRNASGTPAGRHATFVAGCAAGDERDHAGAHQDRGSAWAARLVCGNRNDLHQPNTVFAELAAAMAAGAFIHTNSWHFDTGGAGRPARYTPDSADVDGFAFLNEDHLVLGSAGNKGEEQGPPGTAKNAVCVGAARVVPDGPQFADGNPGPTADGRRKPDLLFPGCDIESALEGTPCGTGRFSAVKPCATSFATPRGAGAAALVRQYFTEGWHPSGTPRPPDARTPSGALLKAVLLNATVGLPGIADRPSDLAGWGLVRLDRVLAFADGRRELSVWDVRHDAGMRTGDVRTHQLAVPPSAAELRVTLVWTDPPPAPGSATTVVVNHLSLVVVGPDGQAHSGGDGIDPGQMVVIPAPAPGDWTIETRAREVNVGRPGQGYALVAVAEAV